MSKKIIQENINGYEVFQAIDPTTKSSMVSLSFQAGSRYDENFPNGTAHFFEHLLMKQTNEYTDPTDRYLMLEELGITSNAFTNLEQATYFHEQRIEHTIESLKFLFNDLHQSIFTPEELEIERKVIINEILDAQDDIQHVLDKIAYSTLFPNQIISTPVLGDEKSVKKIKLQHLKDFYKENYLNAVPVIGIFSNKYLDLSEILPKISKKIKKKKIVKQKITPAKVRVKTSKYAGPRSAVGFYYPTLPITGSLKEIVGLNILKNCIGNCWSSLLVKKLRNEKSLTYWVEAITFFGIELGTFEIKLQCKAKQINKIVSEINKVLDELNNGVLNERVFTAGKEIHLAAVAEEYSSISLLLEEAIQGKILDVPQVNKAKYLRIAKTITKGDILKLAKKYLTTENRLVVKIIGEQ